MMLPTRIGCVRELSCFVSLSSFNFQRNWKPGFRMFSTEIFVSVRIHDERCASPLLVTHSCPPRWAVAEMTQVKQMIAAKTTLLVIQTSCGIHRSEERRVGKE